MAKEKMVYFRTALGGFNREDVNTYIEKLNAEFAERDRVAKKKLDASEAKCTELTDSVEAKDAALNDAAKQLEEARLRIAALEEEANQRENIISEYRETVDAQKDEIAALEASRIASESEISELSARIESLSEAICKSEKYDDISGQIGEIILSAKSTAEDIIAKAEKDADAKRAKADEQIEDAAASFNARAANATSSIKSQMKKLAYESYEILRNRQPKPRICSAILPHTSAPLPTLWKTNCQQARARQNLLSKKKRQKSFQAMIDSLLKNEKSNDRNLSRMGCFCTRRRRNSALRHCLHFP